MATMSETLKRAIRESGLSGLELSKQSGVPASGISRFMAGTAELRTANVDRLCKALGLVLVTKNAGTTRKGA